MWTNFLVSPSSLEVGKWQTTFWKLNDVYRLQLKRKNAARVEQRRYRRPCFLGLLGHPVRKSWKLLSELQIYTVIQMLRKMN